MTLVDWQSRAEVARSRLDRKTSCSALQRRPGGFFGRAGSAMTAERLLWLFKFTWRRTAMRGFSRLNYLDRRSAKCARPYPLSFRSLAVINRDQTKRLYTGVAIFCTSGNRFFLPCEQLSALSSGHSRFRQTFEETHDIQVCSRMTGQLWKSCGKKYNVHIVT